MLRKNFFTSEEIEKLVKDFRSSGLAEVEVAIMEFAQKVVTDAHLITQDDIQELRDHGLDDQEVFDIILTASARSFFALTLDAVGSEPDEAYLDEIHDIADVLSVGREYKRVDQTRE